MTQATINFTVDARLLQELGERLVGKPATALAELVKNAYDADASFAEIVFEPNMVVGTQGEKGEISVRDDGHGMTFEDFRDFWMRVGTTHKADKRTSPDLERQMTGSKGVGRLSVQFLAHRLELKTVPKSGDGTWIWAYVDWDDAVESGDLTSATVIYETRTDVPPFEQGTELRLEWLKQTWNDQDLRELAREIWWLQPPFRREVAALPAAQRFEIRFLGAEDAFREFRQQLDAVLKIQMARIVGTYREGRAKIAIEFWERGSRIETFPYVYTLADIIAPEYRGKEYDPKDSLRNTEFEIRIYKAEYKQPFGIAVEDLREYLERFSGVHVYDGPFRLPYYGIKENDWLGIESDHSKRMFESRLLPKPIQEAFKDTERLRYLPTLRRIIGTVRVDTTAESKLKIQITRDRLVENQAHEDLRYIVRYAIDLYAYHAARKAVQAKSAVSKVEKPSESLRRVEDILVQNRDQIPRETYQRLEAGLRRASQTFAESQKVERDAEMATLSILAPLATAGISALAIQHELRKQFGKLEEIVTTLQDLRTGDSVLDIELQKSAKNLRTWLERARATNRVFDYISADTVRDRKRFRAKVIVKNILEQMTFMALGVTLDTSGLDADLYLPEASFAEWGAVFQNVFSNAFNAMFGNPRRVLAVSSRTSGNRRAVLIQDTGIGVDLKRAERLFQPFERAIEDDPVRRQLGYGGTGLGLTIVHLLCERIGCVARFTQPDTDFSTAFTLEWDEKIAKRKVSE